MRPLRGAVAALALIAAGCECVTFDPGTSFRCVDGACPAGFTCSADGYCDALATDGGGGAGGSGGSGGGAGGGSGGSGGSGGAGGGTEALAPCTRAWCWEHPRPWGEAGLNAVTTTGANSTWVVGDNGAVFHWNGAAWRQGTSEPRYDLNDVWVSPEGEVLAVGNAGTLVQLVSGRFASRASPGVETLLGLDGTSANDFWVVGANARIARFQAGAWANHVLAPAGATYSDVSVADPGRGLMVGAAIQLWTGTKFEPLPAPIPSLGAVWVVPGGDVWLGGTAGGLFRQSGALDGGWTPVNSATSQTVTSLWATDGGELYYGAGDGVYRVNASGQGERLNSVGSVTDLSGSDRSNIWAVTYDGQVVRRTLAGGSFSDARQLVSVSTVELSGVSLNADGTAFAAGENHVAMRRNGSGQWTTVPVEGAQTGTGLYLWDVWSDGFERAVAVGNDPTRLAEFDAASGTFKRPAGFTPAQPLYAVWGSGSVVYAGGAAGYLIRNSGSGWQQVTGLPRSFVIDAIWGLSPTNLWVAGENLTILHFDGTQWTVENEGGASPLYGMGGDATAVYAVGQGGVVLRRSGTTWTQETTNVTYTFQNVVTSDGVTMAVASEGELLRRETSGAWVRLGSTVRDGLPLWGLAGAPGRGFLAVGEDGTIVRWTP